MKNARPHNFGHAKLQKHTEDHPKSSNIIETLLFLPYKEFSNPICRLLCLEIVKHFDTCACPEIQECVSFRQQQKLRQYAYITKKLGGYWEAFGVLGGRL